MDLYPSIARRKSCRHFDMQPLPKSALDEIDSVIRTLKPLYPDRPLRHRVVAKAKGPFLIAAPHYLIISGEGKMGERENAGFLFQQLVLWMDSADLGSVWLGKSKDAEGGETENDLITIAFGRSPVSIHRTADEFKRKPLAEITNAPDDEALQAVHIAPSGMNLQPWYFARTENAIQVYRQKLKPPTSLLYKLTDVDMGIALCHYAVARAHASLPFSFTRSEDLPPKKGFDPFGVIGG